MGCDSQFDRSCCYTSMMSPHAPDCSYNKTEQPKSLAAEPKPVATLSAVSTEYLVEVWNLYDHGWEPDKHQQAPYGPLIPAQFHHYKAAKHHAEMARERWPSDKYRIIKIDRQVIEG